jgi:hypothetical protein
MSFQYCTQPYCLFEGDWLNSPAEPGRCTQEPGYIANAEISELIANEANLKVWHDDASDSDMLVYHGVCCLGLFFFLCHSISRVYQS